MSLEQGLEVGRALLHHRQAWAIPQLLKFLGPTESIPELQYIKVSYPCQIVAGPCFAWHCSASPALIGVSSITMATSLYTQSLGQLLQT